MHTRGIEGAGPLHDRIFDPHLGTPVDSDFACCISARQQHDTIRMMGGSVSPITRSRQRVPHFGSVRRGDRKAGPGECKQNQ